MALLLPLFISLGFWQLRRADEVRAILQAQEQKPQEAILQGENLSWAETDNRYRRIQLSGEWDVTHQFLLDNQIHQQQAGYHVLTPLHIQGTDAAVLVNRGWIPAGRDRRQLPDVAMPQGSVQFIGQVEHFPAVGFKLAGAEIPTPGWPSVVQVLAEKNLSERLGYRLLSYQVLFPAEASGGFVRDWKPSSRLNPGKNLGYALQWFSFAALLVILYVWYGFRPKSAG